MNDDSGQAPDPLDGIAEEFLGRFRRGERPSLTEYVKAHPNLADDIRELFPALVELEAMKSGPRANTREETMRGRDPVPDRLGDYQILREVGRGGMGVVYEAIQQSLGRRVALKVLPPELLVSPKFLQRFQREARSAGGLHHSNIVPVFGVGEHDRHHFYAMQFIRGQTLEAVLNEVRRLRQRRSKATAAPPPEGPDRGPTQIAVGLMTGDFAATGEGAGLGEALTLEIEKGREASRPAHAFAPPHLSEPPDISRDSLAGQEEARYHRSVARIALQVAEALAHAHGQGVLHRDIKPSNVLIDLQGTAWVADFGLAKPTEGDDVTGSRDIVGTMRYMAPERFEGLSDARSDVFSLAATLYEMITLRPAFAAQDQARLIQEVLHHEPDPPRRVDRRIPRDLETIVLKGLAKEPSHRYATAAAMAEDLRRFLSDRTLLARRFSPRERFWRWCKRNPFLAASNALAATLTMAIAVISTIAAIQLKGQRDDLSAERGRTIALLKGSQRLERERTEELARSYLAQARASRMSGRAGRRFETLAAIEKSARIARDLNMPASHFDALCDEAIAALALVDVRPTAYSGGDARTYQKRSFDGNYERYAAADARGNVVVRRTSDDAELFRLLAFGRGYPPWVKLSRDGRTLLVVGEDITREKLRLYRLEEGRAPAAILPEETEDRVWGDGCFSPDGKTCVFQSPGSPLTLVDLETGEQRRLPPSVGEHTAVAFHPAGDRLAVALSRDGKHRVEVRGLLDPRAEAATPVPSRTKDLFWAPDGIRLLAIGEDRRPVLWGLVSGTSLTIDGIHNGGIHAAFQPRGDIFITNGWEMRLRVWSARTGRQLFSTPFLSSYTDHFADDGKTIGGQPEGIGWRRYELADGREYRTCAGLSTGKDAGYFTPSPHAISPDGRFLVMGLGWLIDGFALWDLERGEEIARVAGTGAGGAAIFDADGSLLTTGRWGLHRWPIHAREEDGAGPTLRIGPPESLLLDDFTRSTIARDRDGRVVALSLYNHGYEHAAIVLDRDSGKTLTAGPQEDVRHVAISPDGRWVATCTWVGNNQGVFVWDGKTGERVAVLPAADPTYATFSPDGSLLITCGSTADAIGWSVGTWERGPDFSPATRLWFSPRGDIAASWNNSSAVKLSDPKTGRAIATLDDPNQDRTPVAAFTPDGTRLVCMGPESESFHIWDLRLIRESLKGVGLDWDRPPFPAITPRGETPVAPIRIEVSGQDRISPAARGWTLATEGRYEEAAEVLSHAVDRNPRDSAAWRADALVLLAMGDLERHRVVCERMLGLFESTRDPTLANLVSWLCSVVPGAVNDPSQPLALADRALAREPANPLILNTRAAALHRMGRHAEAIRDLERAVALQKNEGTAFDHFLLAMAHRRLGHDAIAREWLGRGERWVAAAERGEVEAIAVEMPLTWDSRLELRLLREEAEREPASPEVGLPDDVFAPDAPK